VRYLALGGSRDAAAQLSSELSTKKREEKEVRLKRDQHLSTIREHEKDMQKLETSLVRERDLHADMCVALRVLGLEFSDGAHRKRRFEEQCGASASDAAISGFIVDGAYRRIREAP
jgi:hypothetical protein